METLFSYAFCSLNHMFLTNLQEWPSHPLLLKILSIPSKKTSIWSNTEKHRDRHLDCEPVAWYQITTDCTISWGGFGLQDPKNQKCHSRINNTVELLTGVRQSVVWWKPLWNWTYFVVDDSLTVLEFVAWSILEDNQKLIGVHRKSSPKYQSPNLPWTKCMNSVGRIGSWTHKKISSAKFSILYHT